MSRDNTNLCYVKFENLVEVGRLLYDEEIKRPAPTKVGHHDCIYGHGREELQPWGLHLLVTKHNKA